jgi:serine/threonine protein kinase/AAA+ superfamily predicted ATPase
MAIHLDLQRVHNEIRVFLASDEEFIGETVFDQETEYVQDEDLQSLCRDAQECLERAVTEEVAADDWRDLLQVGTWLSDLLPSSKRNDLWARAAQANAPLTLRLRDELIAVPWELMRAGEDQLLSEAFTVGRQIAMSAGSRAAATPLPLTEPIEVLIVYDRELPLAVQEAQELRKRLSEYAPRVEARLLHSTSVGELFRRLPNVDILHFAGEAEPDPERPDYGGWRLSAHERLTAEAVMRRKITRWPAFVFANACRTAEITRRVGRLGLDGVGINMLRCGVRYYVSTFARIPDEGLVVHFAMDVYERLLDRQSVGAALAGARRALSQDGVNLRGRILGANYLLYGPPTGYLLEPPAQRPAPRPPRPRHTPESIGSYRLLGELGHGNYGRVFRAATSDGTEAALCVAYNQHEDVVCEQVEQFRSLQGRLRHPGLVPILDVGRADGWFYIAYELVEGRTLQKLMDERPGAWPVEEALHLLEGLGAALDAAHQEKLVHGELSPASVLVTSEGTPRLLDVGRAEALGRAGRHYAAAASDPYRAPEQWRSPVRGAVSASDLWAYSVLAYRLLSGHHPFEQGLGADGDWSLAVLDTQPQPIAVHPVDLPQAFNTVFLNALSAAPTHRYASASELLQALRRARAGSARVGGFRPDLETALESGAPLLYIESDDEFSTLLRLRAIAHRSGRPLHTWRLTTGISEGVEPGPSGEAAGDPLRALNWVAAQQEPALLVLLDYDVFLDPMPVGVDPMELFREVSVAACPNPPFNHGMGSWDRTSATVVALGHNERTDRNYPMEVVSKERISQRLQELVPQLQRRPRSQRPAVVILAPCTAIPLELSKTMGLFLPEPLGPAEVGELLREAAAAAGSPDPEWPPGFVLNYAWHASGLTASEVRYSLGHSIARRGELAPACLEDLQRDKERIVQRSGLLELWHPDGTIADVVGLEQLKAWFDSVRVFMSESPAVGLLPPSRGVLLGGMPGCGKSFCAKAMAGSLGWPLLRLDVGRVFGGLLGQSEENMRTALGMAQRLSPVVMWIDEIDKGFGYAPGAGGATQRVFHTFLTWLQERAPGVFLVATANDDQRLPPELLRAGRFDACFFLDLPTAAERAELLRAQLRRQGRDTAGHDFERLARAADGFSSAELCGRVTNALFVAASEGRRDPTAEELYEELTAEPPPLARRSEYQQRIGALREMWLTFARRASSTR